MEAFDIEMKAPPVASIALRNFGKGLAVPGDQLGQEGKHKWRLREVIRVAAQAI